MEYWIRGCRSPSVTTTSPMILIPKFKTSEARQTYHTPVTSFQQDPYCQMGHHSARSQTHPKNHGGSPRLGDSNKATLTNHSSLLSTTPIASGLTLEKIRHKGELQNIAETATFKTHQQQRPLASAMTKSKTPIQCLHPPYILHYRQRTPNWQKRSTTKPANKKPARHTEAYYENKPPPQTSLAPHRPRNPTLSTPST